MEKTKRRTLSKGTPSASKHNTEADNEELKAIHFPSPLIVAPSQAVTVGLIGCGGTGSNILQLLVKVNLALIAMEHPGITVYVNDPDVISQSNIVRQVFAPQDIGQPKAKVLIERINRIYGFVWKYSTQVLTKEHTLSCNIVISATDTISSRVIMSKILPNRKSGFRHDSEVNLYWIDAGNNQSSGQVILGTFGTIEQPKTQIGIAKGKLKNVTEYIQGYSKIKEPANQPSCSVMESLSRQDLMINNIIAGYAVHLLWSLFKQPYIDTQGYFINLGTGITQPVIISLE